MLDNNATFTRLTAFLLDSPLRYGWFPRRFVVMPDHIHLIAHQGNDAVRLGQWIKALKAVVGGLERQTDTERAAGETGFQEHDVVGPVTSPGAGGDVPPTTRAETAGLGNPAYNTTPTPVGRVPSPGASVEPPRGGDVRQRTESKHASTRIKRSWRWQDGFHDYKLRSREGEQRKWEYVCLNPVRYGLVTRPEDWPFGGEVFYDASGGPTLVTGTSPLFETGQRGSAWFRAGKPVQRPASGSRLA